MALNSSRPAHSIFSFQIIDLFFWRKGHNFLIIVIGLLMSQAASGKEEQTFSSIFFKWPSKITEMRVHSTTTGNHPFKSTTKILTAQDTNVRSNRHLTASIFPFPEFENPFNLYWVWIKNSRTPSKEVKQYKGQIAGKLELTVFSNNNERQMIAGIGFPCKIGIKTNLLKASHP